MYKQPEVQNLTLKILERLNKDGIRSTSVSKGIYPRELKDTKKYGDRNEYGSTIVWASDKHRKLYEPGASPLKARIKALKNLHRAGLKTWVSMEPYPTPNIANQDIREILSEISFVDKIVFGRWNYSKKVSEQPYYKEFYNSTAKYVIEFCADKSIEVHIKEGTICENLLFKNHKEEFVLKKYISSNNVKPSLFAV